MVTIGAGVAGLGMLEPGRADERQAVSSGWPEIDALLPGGGVRRGSLVEWIADAGGGAGAATLACAIACRLATTRRMGCDAGGEAGGDEPRGGMIVVVDRAGWFHPPAVLPWLGSGAAAARLVVARPSRDDDELWAIDQALRSAGVAAVVAWPRTVAAWSAGGGAGMARGRAGRGALNHWTTAMRRWQLAARSGGAVGLVVRPPEAVGEPSWAESRLEVTALADGARMSAVNRRLRITRVGGRWCGGAAARPVEIAIDLGRGRATGAAPCRA